MTPWTAEIQTSLFFTISQTLLRLIVRWVHDTIQPSRPLSPPSPPALCLSQHQGLFQWVSSSHRVAEVLEQYSGPISFRMDWFDLLAIHGTLKSLLELVFSFSSDIYPELELLLGGVVVLFLDFGGPSVLFPIVAALVLWSLAWPASGISLGSVLLVAF